MRGYRKEGGGGEEREESIHRWFVEKRGKRKERIRERKGIRAVGVRVEERDEETKKQK